MCIKGTLPPYGRPGANRGAHQGRHNSMRILLLGNLDSVVNTEQRDGRHVLSHTNTIGKRFGAQTLLCATKAPSERIKQRKLFITLRIAVIRRTLGQKSPSGIHFPPLLSSDAASTITRYGPIMAAIKIKLPPGSITLLYLAIVRQRYNRREPFHFNPTDGHCVLLL